MSGGFKENTWTFLFYPKYNFSIMLVFDGQKYTLFLDSEEPYKSRFRLEKITIFVNAKSDMVDIDLSQEEDFCDSSTCQFSLLIGVNGVGKTTILRGIIDFFIDFHEYCNSGYKNYRKIARKNIQVVGAKYYADGKAYDVWKNDNENKFFVNDSDILDRNIPIPNIVASCFGVFDKFPIKNTMTSLNTRYNVPFYTYVGARAANNTFSVISTIFQMLYNVLSLEKTDTILKVRDLLHYMGYEDRMTLTCRIRRCGDADTLDDLILAKNKTMRGVGPTTIRRGWYLNNFQNKSAKEKQKVFLKYCELEKQLKGGDKGWCRCDFEFNQGYVQYHKDEIRSLYQLRQLGLITQTSLFLYRNGECINSFDISSGELNMFCTVVGALSASEKENALILIDEPEISQHPNWQMSIIDLLNEGLKASPCHLLIATHSHFLVSDLPRHQSTVTYLNKTDEGLVSERIKEDTYGWSAEEVLLKVFKVPTTRNIYLAKIVGDMLDRIAKGDIEYQEVAANVQFLKKVMENMSEVDPMKKIITTIVNTFKHEK